ncbi:MAG: DUF1343 domain-containing protein [Fimbriimonadaceae bacterium]|nr:DUF1343 domain-containing protein [Fimbriimonadaceae bacterium]
MATLNGIDALIRDDFGPIRGRAIGVVCNQASIAKDLRHFLDHLLPLHRAGDLRIVAGFGPQHGIWGHTQDNMIEWEGYDDPRTGLRFHSLYGEHREPTDAMLAGIETLVVDIVDVGARYYTFIWTLALCMKACERLGIEVLVLDRVNPVGGAMVEGTVLDPAFASFVGLYPLPTRHGMTAGEIAGYLKAAFFPRCDLRVVPVEGWVREQCHDGTDLAWAMPSPNMPTVQTAMVYPGQCLLEATELSEGRGTTRPFEIFGAPYLDGWRLAEALNGLVLPGVWFRPYAFEPTFHKFAGQVCEGCHLHVTDRSTFEPVLTTVALLQEVVRQAGGAFAWKEPPYEYEYRLMPMDILAGNGWLRAAIDALAPLDGVRERMCEECVAFAPVRAASLIY